ncbi:Cd2+/Zn2+-exporting ATPase [Hathewaya proteolytica DSM 3090]|uniref:Cd2+/Zn2+-exporting ATPase n=1 Tax=Hathewaya proteolytica DSM 3090 TaxID=1121331 RepID=A0A1M6KAM8_9CLOT|nr:heavy metal translocating P-type ATPase [Hathewaya proteolytica]SHJ55949.1 Cd2+/Zn2+-exporting ATPase [Hathewaya proteolytica DSM 3090]
MKKDLSRIIISAILFILALTMKGTQQGVSMALFMASYVIVGIDVVWGAIKNIVRGHVFDENFLMAIATIGAIAIKQYPEAVAVMLFYQVGELFQSYAVNKSRKSIADLMDIRPDYANLVKGMATEKVDPYDVQVGDIILVRPGEKVPLDGVVEEGQAMLDTSALTGESVPKSVKIGKEILSGCINLNGSIKVRVTKEFSESTVTKILDLVENASNKKSNSENFITKFAAVYTPIVVICAVLLAVIPPLVIKDAVFSDWFYRALNFLVVSCPCALVISVPLSFFGGIGGASKAGILVKGSNYLEALADTEVVVFDKTGTLTAGVFEVQDVNPVGISKDELIKIAALAEKDSNHPIAHSLKKAYKGHVEKGSVKDIQEISGKGISAVVEGKKVLAGNDKLMKLYNIKFHEKQLIGTIVHVAVNDEYLGYIVISDRVKSDSKESIRRLKKSGVKKTVMLTGDARFVGENVGKDLNLDEVYTELLPGDKVDKLESLMEAKSSKGKLVFVGDGINDAPVLARADIGIAMGGVGSDAAIEAADVVIMNDEISKIAQVIDISRKTLGIVYQNIYFAIGVKILVLILSAFGLSNMWEAVFADVGVSVIAIVNAMRCLKVGENSK